MIVLRQAASVLAAIGLALAFNSAALSAETPVTIDSRAPALEEAGGGGWTTSLGFTNLTDKGITLIATASDASDRGCHLSLDHAQLPTAEHSAVTVTVPAGCKVGKDGIDFKVSAKAGATSPVTFVVTAAPKPGTNKPDWSALWAFPIALGGLLAVVAFYLLLWPGRRRYNQPLKYLEATWSFNDSWVSNVTVIGGLLAGIFGSSDVVTALLGDDAKSSVALATVGAAAAAALIAAGPIVLLATKSKAGDFVTVGGFLIASAITLGGAAGELWVVDRSGQKLDLGGWEDRILVLAVAGFVLLALYAMRAIPATIQHGTTKLPATLPPDTMAATESIFAALDQHKVIGATNLRDALEHVTTSSPEIAPRAARPRRSALL